MPAFAGICGICSEASRNAGTRCDRLQAADRKPLLPAAAKEAFAFPAGLCYDSRSIVILSAEVAYGKKK